MSSARNVDFSKDFFIQSWPGGYYENFSYGVGIEKVWDFCVLRFAFSRDVLEIGSGGGVFSNRMFPIAKSLTCIDVILKPENLKCHKYIELNNKSYSCKGVYSESIDFAFSYNVFCHFSNEAIRQYLKSVQRVLRPGGDFVFMLSAYGRGQELGILLPMGHFSQDERTLPLVIGEGWEVISPNMILEHRDIIVHLKKN